MAHPFQDLSYLNRDLSKVVALDTDPTHYMTHPEHSVIVPKWKGDSSDKGLISMIPFLECIYTSCVYILERDLTNLLAIAIYKPADVRPILEAYRDKDIPIEYAKKEAEAKANHLEEWKKKSRHVSSSSFSSLFGLSQQVLVPNFYVPRKYGIDFVNRNKLLVAKLRRHISNTNVWKLRGST